MYMCVYFLQADRNEFSIRSFQITFGGYADPAILYFLYILFIFIFFFSHLSHSVIQAHASMRKLTHS